MIPFFVKLWYHKNLSMQIADGYPATRYLKLRLFMVVR
jgi:hypothetical protein